MAYQRVVPPVAPVSRGWWQRIIDNDREFNRDVAAVTHTLPDGELGTIAGGGLVGIGGGTQPNMLSSTVNRIFETAWADGILDDTPRIVTATAGGILPVELTREQADPINDGILSYYGVV